VNDSELIVRAALDDREAFGVLVQRHQSTVRHFLRHLTRGDAALADDLAQETFVQAWRSLVRYHGGSAFSTWLLGIAHNQWRNFRRRRQHDSLDDVPGAEPAVTSTIAQSDLRHDLAAALDHLDPEEQMALHLAYQQGLSHAEIAALLNWPVGTVKTHLARGKNRLRQLLAVWNPPT
jgi:RNA polymerase sigma-70 factor (ECF subfamily)